MTVKTSTMTKHEEGFPIFHKVQEFPDGTKIEEWKRPHLPLYVRIALINLYEENCELRRKAGLCVHPENEK